MEALYENIWSSIVNFCNDVIEGKDAQYVDWEAHANMHELPEGDLVGSTAITFTEEEPELFSGSFAIGVSTQTNDTNLFRLRKYVGEIFSKLRPGMKVALFDRETMAQLGWLYVVNGTMVMPMTRADARPLQFIQCNFTFDAVTAVPS